MIHSNLVQRVDALLLRHQQYWRSNPFQLDAPTWARDENPLCHWLLRLGETQVHDLQADDRKLLTALSPYFPPADEILDIVGDFTGPQTKPAEEPPPTVPGRKWQQVLNFYQAQPAATGNVLEWCCGKAHLGRYLAHGWGQPVTGLDVNPQLVLAGNALAQPQLQLFHCDVLSDDVWRHFLPSPTRAVALHACGGLHQRLLHCAATRRCPEIALAPCCYHRFTKQYLPLSRQLRLATLQLGTTDLRSAVRQSCTARRGEIRARRHLQCWQLAFRLLLRDNGQDPAMPLPSPRSKPGDFAALREEYCREKALNLPLQRPLQDYLRHGRQALARAESLELMRMAFRRLLELRCVLDSVLYLEEHGYQCKLTAFCSAAVTPRNLLIFARRG